MDDGVRRARGFGFLVAGEVEVRCQGVEDLAAICEVGFQSEDVCRTVGKVHKIEVENGVALGEEVGDDMSTGFARAAGEDYTFG